MRRPTRLCSGPLAMGRVARRRAGRAIHAPTRGREATVGQADVPVGREIESVFILPLNLLMLIQFSFQAEL